MKVDKWEGWAITMRGGLVIFDGRHPIYWKRYIAKREAEERGLTGFRVVKVKVMLADGPAINAVAAIGARRS
jgi:hypothetical protein